MAGEGAADESAEIPRPAADDGNLAGEGLWVLMMSPGVVTIANVEPSLTRPPSSLCTVAGNLAGVTAAGLIRLPTGSR